MCASADPVPGGARELVGPFRIESQSDCGQRPGKLIPTSADSQVDRLDDNHLCLHSANGDQTLTAFKVGSVRHISHCTQFHTLPEFSDSC